jgi:serine/threonine protein kinase
MPGEQLRTQSRLIADRYQLRRELGRGAMGVVWLADDQLFGRQVAVKELRPPPGLSDSDRDIHSQRALREARSAARIQHPNAVTVHDVLPATAADDAIYLIMELIGGPTLAQLIRDNGPLPDAAVASLGLQLLDVLQAAHSLGIVHRDLKPRNIMIAGGNQVKLTDFGLAHTVGDPRLTDSGTMGTWAYMAPELFSDKPITPAADLWSLGATLYCAAEGHGPFARETPEATVRAVLIDDVAVPDCSPRLAGAISAMLRRDPQRRATLPQARTQLQAAIRPAADDPPTESPPVAKPPPRHQTPPPEHPKDKPPTTTPKPPPHTVPPPSPHNVSPPPRPTAPTIFTNMPSRFTLACVRAGWVIALIASAVGCFIIANSSGLALAALAFVLWFILLFVGTVFVGHAVMQRRTLVLDSRGLAVSVATFNENQHRRAEARWDQIVRIGCFKRPGKPQLFLSAWISDGESKPGRMVGLCPVGTPHFPMDEIQTAIRSYCPTVNIDLMPDR